MSRKDKVITILWPVASSTLALVMTVFSWPVLLWPGLWDGYTCWESDDVQNN